MDSTSNAAFIIRELVWVVIKPILFSTNNSKTLRGSGVKYVV